MNSINFNTLDLNARINIFSFAVGADFPLLEKLATVCKEWKNILQDNVFWKPIFDFHIKDLTYQVDLSSVETYQEKVKLFINSGRKELQSVLDQINCKIDALHVLNKNNDVTELFETMIKENKFEPLAFCLLFKPSFDANKIAELLYSSRGNRAIGAAAFFCFQLLIKSHYNLSAFFQKHLSPENLPKGTMGNEAKMSIYNEVVLRLIDGLTLGDYLKSGFNLNAFENKDYSVVDSVLWFASRFYQTGKFSLDHSLILTPSSFLNKKLVELESKNLFSENELQQLIHDVVFDPKLNRMPEFQVHKSGNNRSMTLLEIVSNLPSLPATNAIKGVFEEYQQSLKLNPKSDQKV